MPLYEYRCTQCGHRFEKIQTFTSTPLTECPVCQGKLERPLTAPALQFKGAGWYVNDYAGKAKSSSADSSSPDSSSSDKPAADKPSATPSADAKPATSESKPASSQSSSGSAPASGSTSSSATA